RHKDLWPLLYTKACAIIHSLAFGPSFWSINMAHSKWITFKEAAQILNETEDAVGHMVDQSILQAKKEGVTILIDRDHLVAWMKHRSSPRVEVAQIYGGIQRTLLEHFKTIFSKEQAQHPGIRGGLYEDLVRDFLRDYLPHKYYLGAGQVLSSNPVMDDD